MEHADIQLLDRALSVEACLAAVATHEAGGTALFLGTVRRQTQGRAVLRLEFEAYQPMAIREMRKIADQARQQYGILGISIHHRIGILGLGEAAVIIAAAAPHRQAAFAACHQAIDTLKQTVPIWKKEIFEDGAIWVAAHP